MDDIFADTKARMSGFTDDEIISEGYSGQQSEEAFDPELPVTGAQTMTLVKDYSALLKRADEIANQSRG
jgi:hypothetical protein